MPIFEYKCGSCGSTFEKLVRPEDKIECIECGSDKVAKLFSAFAAHFGSSDSAEPACAPTCGNGFSTGKCGSGMCGHNH
ncbi:MAG: zinc ribbon domain-containing protein [Spirochaetales bacterium]|nr:zinc ribbon domain-containing protein [Spirochaetales bacterium]